VTARGASGSRDVILQANLSATNLIRDPELLRRFDFKLIGCSAHARRPFALYEHEDPVYGPFMVHLFKGPAIHEDQLDVFGRNRQNVLAVRQGDSPYALTERCVRKSEGFLEGARTV
jgi:hypothetical protein